MAAPERSGRPNDLMQASTIADADEAAANRSTPLDRIRRTIGESISLANMTTGNRPVFS